MLIAILTPAYAMATFRAVISPFHHVAVLKTNTIKKHPINPIHAGTGWKYDKTLAFVVCHALRRRSYVTYISSSWNLTHL